MLFPQYPQVLLSTTTYLKSKKYKTESLFLPLHASHLLINGMN